LSETVERQPHVMIHDYAGHPFTAAFARHLAHCGVWRVTYVFFAGDGGPKGHNAPLPDDPSTFEIVGLEIARAYSKTNFIRRRQGDVEYGAAIAQCIAELRPDIVLSSSPTECQEAVQRACAKVSARFIYWCQDFYSIAATKILSRKIPVLGQVIGAWYTFLERRQMRRADHVVHITDGFLSVTDRWNVPRDRISVIHNWGVIADIPVLERDTQWAAEQGLTRKYRAIYSGTLAAKHNPELLATLAADAQVDCDVVVIGFGAGADALMQRQNSLPALKVLPLQPFDILPQTLASADVLLAVIERDAGAFSVPSKVLSYLCAGRPIVLAAASDNLAARIVRESGAGVVVDPENIAEFVAQTRALLAAPEQRRAMGLAGRNYAEAHFDLNRVATTFEDLFSGLYPRGKTLYRNGSRTIGIAE